jgi:hypothetical protein
VGQLWAAGVIILEAAPVVIAHASARDGRPVWYGYLDAPGRAGAVVEGGPYDLALGDARRGTIFIRRVSEGAGGIIAFFSGEGAAP